MQKIELVRTNGDFGFEATDENGHVVKMDSSPSVGGQDFGLRPMQLLLSALGGCSAIDVIAILKKQRQTVTDYQMTIEGEREAGKEPSLWKDITIRFRLFGEIDPDKAQRAVELSLGKYCSVAETLRLAGATIKTEVFVNP